MLVLGRREGQRVQLKVGEVVIWVSVEEARRTGFVRLGIEAPPEVLIRREELLHREEP